MVKFLKHEVNATPRQIQDGCHIRCTRNRKNSTRSSQTTREYTNMRRTSEKQKSTAWANTHACTSATNCRNKRQTARTQRANIPHGTPLQTSHMQHVDCHGKAKPSRRSPGLDREPTALVHTRWCIVEQSCIRSIEIEKELDDPHQGVTEYTIPGYHSNPHHGAPIQRSGVPW